MIAARAQTHIETERYTPHGIAQGTTHKHIVQIVLISSLMHCTAALNCTVNGRTAP